MRNSRSAPLVRLAAVTFVVAGCSGGGGSLGSGLARDQQPTCIAVDGEPAEFPIQPSAESSLFPQLDLRSSALRYVSDSAVATNGTARQASDLIVVNGATTATTRVSVDGETTESTEHIWHPERYAERIDGGAWKHVDEPNAYEPPYRFADNMSLMMPSMMAMESALRLTYAGETPLGGVTYTHYCAEYPEQAALAASLAFAHTELDTPTHLPERGYAHLYIHPDGYVAELTSRLIWSGGTAACWAAALEVGTEQPVPSLDAPTPRPPQFQSRFNAIGCDISTLR